MLRYREAVKAGIRKRMTPPARQSVARISVETERAEENLSAYVPDLSGCILTSNSTSRVKPNPDRAPEWLCPSPSFTPEEQQLLSDFNAGELRSVATPELLDALRQSATAMGVKDQRINIRLSSADLQALRVKALQEGIPCQTLISSVLHKYVSGSLLDRSVA